MCETSNNLSQEGTCSMLVQQVSDNSCQDQLQVQKS
jgi:hypothetical protein